MTNNPGPSPRWRRKLLTIIRCMGGWRPPREVVERLEVFLKDEDEEIKRIETANRTRRWRDKHSA
ncbi:MAG: hypothetical protein V3S20_06495 [Dehalococcoidia bacterium]